MKPFQELAVIEIGGSIAGAYCAKLFADAGARVRVLNPSTLDHADGIFLHRGKEPILELPDLATADVVIESSAPAPLPSTLATPNSVIHVQISPLGSTGPRSDWHATDLVDYALSGHQYLYGDPGREPLAGPADQPAVAAGLFAFVGAMAALFDRDQPRDTSEPSARTVEVSHMETMVALHQLTLIRQTMSGSVLCRMGNRYTGQGQPNTLYQCSDGWVAIAGVTTAQVETILAVAGLDHLMDHPDINSVMDFTDHPEIMDVPLRSWLAEQRVDEIVELMQALRIPAGPNRTMLQLLDEPQLLERMFWETDPAHSEVKLPGRPVRVTHHDPPAGNPARPARERDTDDAGPLTGLRVLDLTRVWAGPLATRILSDLGAQVTWLEAPWSRGPGEIPDSLVNATRWYPDNIPGPDPWNRNAHYNKYSLGKESIVLDLQKEEGRDALARLIPHYDVVIENYSSRVMPQLGFDEDRLHALNPNLIYITMPGFGRSGPAEHWVAYGSSADTHAGLSSLIGYPDQSPWKGGVAWPDPIAGLHATAYLLAALWDQEVGAITGGVTIEQSQFESTINAIGHLVTRAQLHGDPTPDANRDQRYALQGTWRCAGTDNWVSLTAVDEGALDRLMALVDPTASASEPDAALSSWAGARSATDAATLLQASGIAAGEVQKSDAVMVDPQLRSRKAFLAVDQPSVGHFEVSRTPIRLSQKPLGVQAPAPAFGGHNRAVLARAGFAEAEIDALIVAGVVVDRPPH